MSIVKDRRFTIPLYHGTTELFIESIKNNGLGGINPLIDLEAIQTMRDLFKLGEKQNWKDESWLEVCQKIRPIMEQQQDIGTLNFKHGEAYLTYFDKIAVKYAVENHIGCEFLTYIFSLYCFLEYRKVKDLQVIFIESPVFKKCRTPQNPYIVTIKNAKVSDFETETGKEIPDQICGIDKLINKGIYGSQSFKLKNPISIENIEITKIGTWDLDKEILIKSQTNFLHLL